MKKVLMLIFSLTLIFFSEVEVGASERTMREIEDILISYLDNDNLSPGTQEYREFLLNQLMFDKDKNLSRRDNYEEIVIYMSAYLNNASADLDTFYDQSLTEVEFSETISSETNNNNILPALVDVEKFKNYANEWWNKRNPEFDDYKDLNCTNYVSQLILAGNVQRRVPNPIPDEHIFKTTDYWYSINAPKNAEYKHAQSSSWINVEDFYRFWSKSQEIISPNNFDALKDLEIGDIVQLQHIVGGSFFHSLAVIDKDHETVYLTANSNNRKRMDIREIKSVNIRAIKFTERKVDHHIPKKFWGEYNSFGFGTFNETASTGDHGIHNMVRSSVLDGIHSSLVHQFAGLRLGNKVGDSISQDIHIKSNARDFSLTNQKIQLGYSSHRGWDNVWRYQSSGNLGAGKHNRDEQMAYFLPFASQTVKTADGTIECTISYRNYGTIQITLTRIRSEISNETIFTTNHNVIVPINIAVNRWNGPGTRVNDYVTDDHVSLISGRTGPVAAWNIRNNVIYN